MTKEAAALDATPTEGLRAPEMRLRVVEVALLEMLGTAPPEGHADWTLSLANSILAVSQRNVQSAFEAHRAKWPSLRTVARCHSQPRSRFVDISGGGASNCA